jgi:putative endonuclease
MSSVPDTSPEDPRRRLGRAGERCAEQHLQRLGYTLIERNHRTRHGEVDLIVGDSRRLVFVEVKTRVLPARAGSTLDAVPIAKQRRIRALAAAWLQSTSDRPRVAEVRFDVIGLTLDPHGRLVALDHVEGAF